MARREDKEAAKKAGGQNFKNEPGNQTPATPGRKESEQERGSRREHERERQSER